MHKNLVEAVSRKKRGVRILITICNCEPNLIATLVVFCCTYLLEKKVAVPSLLKTNCKSEPHLITTSQLN
jgi:hypothetical protein